MNCAYCATPLPEGAMFCGECGRSVVSKRVVTRTPDAHRPTAVQVAVTPAKERPMPQRQCTQCRTPMAAGDIFCGVCGCVAPGVMLPAAAGSASDPAVERDPHPHHDMEVESAAAPQPHATTEAEPEFERMVVAPAAARSELVVPIPRDTNRIEIDRDPFPWGLPAAASTAQFDDDGDDEETRIVQRGRHGERFVLQFSTGESVTVAGTGLIGRNPTAEPGEYFDHMVAISDPGKSVSKTHLEFGQDAGVFWISDRFSGNGTNIREPDVEPRRAEPGKRYRLMRGTRVDLGEQFVVVS